MVGVAKRMSKLTELMHLKVGDGAVVLPPEVRKIQLDFAVTRDPGHNGPRIFWRNQMRRLKYHNPRLECAINRSTAGEDPATMTLFIAPSSSTPSDPPTPPSTAPADANSAPDSAGLRTEQVDIKNMRPGAILDEIMKLVPGGKQIEPTEEDLKVLEEISEMKKSMTKTMKANEVRNTAARIEKEKELLRKGAAVQGV